MAKDRKDNDGDYCPDNCRCAHGKDVDKEQEINLESRYVKPISRFFGYDSPRWLAYAEWWIRVKIFRQPSYLIDRWTFIEEYESDD